MFLASFDHFKLGNTYVFIFKHFGKACKNRKSGFKMQLLKPCFWGRKWDDFEKCASKEMCFE